MSRQTTIREMHAKGESVTGTARVLGIDRKTVYRYLEQDDFSPKPPIVTERPSKPDPYKLIIGTWLEEDKKVFRRQRRTVARIKKRPEEEHGFVCGHSTIQAYVGKVRTTAHEKAYLGLVWDPGIAQVDFGEAGCVVDGECMRCHYLVLPFPYSNMGYLQMSYGEMAERITQGLIAVFGHIGGVPSPIVFGNAAGIGERIGKAMVESELFSRFRTHYLFDARFCNPASGWEKGDTERLCFIAHRSVRLRFHEAAF